MTKYFECKFSDVTYEVGMKVRFDIQKKGSLKYLGSIIQEIGEINEDVTHRISAGWMKWRLTSKVLCEGAT